MIDPAVEQSRLTRIASQAAAQIDPAVEQSRLTRIYVDLRERLLDLSLRNPMLNYKHRASSKKQLQIVDAVPEEVYRRLVAEGVSLELLPLPDPKNIPADEDTEEFVAALAHAKSADIEYLTKIQALENAGRDDDFTLAEVDRDLRERLRQQLGLPPRPTRKTINPADHAREHGINPLLELEGNTTKQEHSGRQLRTMKWSETLDAIMEKISDDARLAEQEMGISTLFLVFGFLEWHEAEDSSKRNFAPLLLLPITINKRKNAKGKSVYSIAAATEAADTNLSLRKRIQKDHDRLLPSFDQDDDDIGSIETYFRDTTKAVEGLAGWKVRRWLTLGHFSFGRFAMYADLDPEHWPAHPVFHELVGPILTGTEISGDGGGSILAPPEDYPIDEPEIERIAPFLIQDADASQHSALIDVMKKKNLVVQGPPGTGKSQTITNIIANALAQKKTVLFLAEKQAALDVVKRRLDKSGLGEFCLELHSGKAVPRQVLESLKVRHKLGYKSPQHGPKPMTANVTWEDSRRDISGYLKSLHKSSSDGETPFSLIWRSLRARTQIGPAIEAFKTIDFPAPVVDKPAEYEVLRGEISLYARMSETYHAMFGSPAKSAWSSIDFGKKAGLGIVTGLFEKLVRLRDSAREIVALIRQAEEFGIKSLDGLDHIIALTQALPSAVPNAFLIERVLKLSPEEVEKLASAKKVVLASYERLRGLPNLSTLGEGQLRLIDNLARAATVAGLAERSPQEISNWAVKEIEDSLAVRVVVEAFLPVTDLLGLSSLPAKALETLCVGVLVARKLTPSNFHWFRWVPPDGGVAFENARSEYWALTHAERKWRAEYPLDENEPWPTAEELVVVVSLMRKGKFGKALGKLAGDTRAISTIAQRLGCHEEVSLHADDLEKLATHVQNCSAFLQNSAHQRALGAAWQGFHTPFDDISDALGLAKKAEEFLVPRPNGEAVLQRIRALDDKGLFCLAQAAPAAEQFRSLNSEQRQQLDDRPIETLLRDLSSAEARARDLLQLDSTGQLVGFRDTIKKLREGAEAELSRCRAEVSFRSLVLANTHNDLVASNDAIDHTRAALEWIALVKSTSRLDHITKAFLSAKAETLVPGISFLAGQAKPRIDELRKLVEEIALEYDTRGFDITAPEKLSDRLEDLLSRRGELAEFLGLRDQRCVLEAQGLGPLIQQVEKYDFPPRLLVDLVSGIVSHRRAERLRRTDPILLKMSGTRLDARRGEFAHRDRLKIQIDRQIIRNLLMGASPPTGNRHGPKKTWTEMELLLNEFGKEKRFTPVRGLMARASDAIFVMKPCFMMSPLSLAKFLPATQFCFDLLVIDEASQMRPEDALGGLLRAKQLIVVGDQKQLPPTDFFMRSDDRPQSGDDNDDFEDIEEESILEVCQKTFRQVRTLRWHYRSRCESLIAFSNKEFYRNDLITFPMARPNSFSVDLAYVAGYYEARRNPAEAQRIAEEAIRFMRRFADIDEESIPTLGIVAVNTEQRDLIFEEIRRLEVNDTLVETYREKVAAKGEPLFVKNLENVQGDERDFILISMTYGPKPGKKEVLQRFGPINGKQGHRRLNVLFTRARSRIAIFTSIKAADIRPTGTSSEGLWVLKRYLEYAEGRGKARVEGVGDQPDSDFEAEVADRLRLRGYAVEIQVGVSGFKIDIAIRHPDQPDKFIIGIECDGATYHSSKSARDRDRLREEVLQGLGWEIVRVWSTDWFDNPDSQAERLVKRIEELRTRPLEPLQEYIIATVYDSPPTSSELSDPITLSDHEVPRVKLGHQRGPLSSPIDIPSDAFERSERLSEKEVGQALRVFRDTIIAVEMEHWEPHRSLLRDAMIETLIAQKVREPDDWFRKIPHFQRAATNAREKQRYLDRICEIVSRLSEVGEATANGRHSFDPQLLSPVASSRSPTDPPVQ